MRNEIKLEPAAEVSEGSIVCCIQPYFGGPIQSEISPS